MPNKVLDGSFAEEKTQALLGQNLEQVGSVGVNSISTTRQDLNEPDASLLELDEVVPVVPVQFAQRIGDLTLS